MRTATPTPAEPGAPIHELHAMLSRSPWAGDLTVRGHRLGDLLPRLPLFELVDGAAEPRNEPAVAMRDSVDGARALDRVGRANSAAAGLTPPATPRYMAFSAAPSPRPYSWDSPIDPVVMGEGGGHEAYALLRMIDALSWMPREVVHGIAKALDRPRADAQLGAQLVANVEKFIDPGIGANVTDGNVVMYSPSMTSILRAPAPEPGGGAQSRTSRWLVEIVDHELQHTTTPAEGSVIQSTGLDWLEEGLSELLSRWPGAADHMAAAMQLPAPIPPRPLDPERDLYDRYADVTRRLATLAGLDIDRPEGLQSARELFQGPALPALPRELAASIATSRGLAVATIPEIERRIAKLDGRRDRMSELERFIDRAGAPSPSDS